MHTNSLFRSSSALLCPGCSSLLFLSDSFLAGCRSCSSSSSLLKESAEGKGEGRKGSWDWPIIFMRVSLVTSTGLKPGGNMGGDSRDSSLIFGLRWPGSTGSWGRGKGKGEEGNMAGSS